jgi:hypothetical protein
MVNTTDRHKPGTGPGRLEHLIARHILEIARGECLIRQRSMLLSLADNRESLAVRRWRLEDTAADYIAQAVSLGVDHGVDVFSDIHGTDLEIVRLALAPLNRKEGRA